MNNQIGIAIIAGIALIVAAFALGGRYSASPVMTGPVAGGGVYIVDRFTGSVKACHFQFCKDLPSEFEVRAAEAVQQGGTLEEQLDRLLGPTKKSK